MEMRRARWSAKSSVRSEEMLAKKMTKKNRMATNWSGK